MSDTDSCSSQGDVDVTDINILLLGEKLSGKSMFINSFGNYLRCPDLDQAIKSDLIFLIPTEFTMHDEHFTEFQIRLAEDPNQKQFEATKESKAYVFPIRGEDFNINLIDTPGIGDGQNPEQDLANFDNILNYISQYQHLNAICLFLNPSVTELTEYFKFCFTNLLRRLDETACKKVVFIINKSRSSFYKPEGSIATLRPFLKSLSSNMQIECSKKNIFCMDNEGFRYLAGLKHGYKFGEMEEKIYKTSWEVSVQAVKNLLDFSKGCEETDSNSLTKYRRFSMNALKPLSDIVTLIRCNLVALINHKRLMLSKNNKLEEIQEYLYVPEIRANIMKCPGQIACLADCCSKYENISQIGVSNIKVCKKGCTLNIISGSLIGCPELLNADLFKSSSKCQICSCDSSTHTYNLYKISMDMKKLKEKKPEQSSDLKFIFDLMEKISERQVKYEEELKEILKVLAIISVFLRSTGIVERNDTFLDLLQFHTNCAKNLPNRDDECSNICERIQKQYQEELNKFSEDDTIPPLDIVKALVKIFKLEFTGPTFDSVYNRYEEVANTQFNDSMKYCYELDLFPEKGEDDQSDDESDTESNVNDDASEANDYESEVNDYASEAGDDASEVNDYASEATDDASEVNDEYMNLVEDKDLISFEEIEPADEAEEFEVLTKSMSQQSLASTTSDNLDCNIKANKHSNYKRNNINKINNINVNESNANERNQQQFRGRGNFRGSFPRGRGKSQFNQQNQQQFHQQNRQQFHQQNQQQFHQQNQQFQQQHQQQFHQKNPQQFYPQNQQNQQQNRQQFHQHNRQQFNQPNYQQNQLSHQYNQAQGDQTFFQKQTFNSQEMMNKAISMEALQKQSNVQYGVNLQSDRGRGRGRGNRRGRGDFANKGPRGRGSSDTSANQSVNKDNVQKETGNRNRGGKGRGRGNSTGQRDQQNLKAGILKQQTHSGNSSTDVNKANVPKRPKPNHSKAKTENRANAKVANNSVVKCAVQQAPPRRKAPKANTDTTRNNQNVNKPTNQNVNKPNVGKVQPSTGAIKKAPAAGAQSNRNQGAAHKPHNNAQTPNINKMLGDIQKNVVTYAKKEMAKSANPSFVFNIQNNHGKPKKQKDNCTIS